MRFIDSPDRQFWWDVALADPTATFYHSPLWNEIVIQTYPRMKDATIGMVTEDGTRAILPAVGNPSFVEGIMTQISSTYAGGYGGVIADGSLSRTHRMRMVEVRTGPLVEKLALNGNVLSPDTMYDGFEHWEAFSQIVSLDPDWDLIVEQFSRGRRSGMEKAKREGVEIRVADSDQDIREYFAAYQECLQRWGTEASSRYPWELFETIWEYAGMYPEHIQFWLAEVDGELASGILTFAWNEHVSYWHGASRKAFFDHRPNDLLHPTVMRHAKRSGRRIYDFNPSGGHDGVVQFKSRFGARKVFFHKAKQTHFLIEAIERHKGSD